MPSRISGRRIHSRAGARRLHRCNPERECLYRGELKLDIAESGAIMWSNSKPNTEFTDMVLNQGWGNHWGVFRLDARPDLFILPCRPSHLTAIFDRARQAQAKPAAVPAILTIPRVKWCAYLPANLQTPEENNIVLRARFLLPT